MKLPQVEFHGAIAIVISPLEILNSLDWIARR